MSDDEQIVKGFEALSSPIRLKLLEHLVKSDKALTVQLLAALSLLPPGLCSYHLRFLYNANLVQRMESGKYVLYSPNTTIIRDLAQRTNELSVCADANFNTPLTGETNATV